MNIINILLFGIFLLLFNMLFSYIISKTVSKLYLYYTRLEDIGEKTSVIISLNLNLVNYTYFFITRINKTFKKKWYGLFGKIILDDL